MDTLNPASQIGLTIANTYKLIRVLGEGSFAVVFLGRNVYTGEQVAVKCLYKQGLTKHQINLQREEVFILEKLKGHPNIVNLLQSVETDHHLYLVLEYCEIDLFDSIMKKPFDSKLALKLFTQLANAVAACHDLGIYHRDLKPENVLISSLRSPVIKLADFGLSTTEYLSSEYGCGSVRYMAPECLKPENKKTSQPYVSPANDVWSLGIILINMLTGKNPWVQPHQNDKHFRAHLLSRQGSIDSFRQQFNFSDSFCQILRMVFQMQPSTRPTVRQFLSMVQQLPTFFHVNNSIAPVKYTPPHKQNGILTPSSLPFQGFHGNTQMLPGTPESFKEPLAWKQVDRKSDDLMFEMELDNTIF